MPSGISNRSAASWWVRSPTTTNSSVSRNSSGSRFRAAWISSVNSSANGSSPATPISGEELRGHRGGRTPLAPLIHGAAAEDGHQPSAITASRLVPEAAFPRRAKGLLDQVFRFVRIANQAIGHPIQSRTVILDQAIKIGLRERQSHPSFHGCQRFPVVVSLARLLTIRWEHRSLFPIYRYPIVLGRAPEIPEQPGKKSPPCRRIGSQLRTRLRRAGKNDKLARPS